MGSGNWIKEVVLTFRYYAFRARMLRVQIDKIVLALTDCAVIGCNTLRSGRIASFGIAVR